MAYRQRRRSYRFRGRKRYGRKRRRGPGHSRYYKRVGTRM